MKTKLTLAVVFALFLSLTVIGCDNEGKNESGKKIISVKELTHTECKLNADKDRIAKSKEYLHLKASDNYLSVFHVDAEFNCCPEELLVKSAIEGKTIIIYEKDKKQGCKCLCKYDLSYKVGTLDYGIYHIVLKKKGETVYKFDLDFNAETNEKVFIE